MGLKDLLFPKFCLGCGRPGIYFCQECVKKLVSINKQVCFYCKKASPFGLTHPKCTKKWGVDGMIAFLLYNHFFRKIISEMKYKLALDVWYEFTQALNPNQLFSLSFFKNYPEALYLQPLPLHHKKIKERGFNQAKILTDFFNQFLNFPVVDYLERKKATLPQARFKTTRERYLNVKGAFKIKEGETVFGKNIILIDDILTTGHTLAEAALVLKKGGAKKVYLLVLARS